MDNEQSFESILLLSIVENHLKYNGYDYLILPALKLSQIQLVQCLNSIADSLDLHYTKLKGTTWKEDKLKEMTDPDLVYILLPDGFISLKIVGEFEFRMLYIYEIHIGPKLRNKGLGTRLMDIIQNIALDLSNNDSLRDDWLENNYQIGNGDVRKLEKGDSVITAVGLTVFTDNINALRFYVKLGFLIHPTSPGYDRHGKINLKRDDDILYYIMHKPLKI
ncbi:N-terminal L-serine N(alpha)-acetyltransferase NatD [Martiniozyma asiatica (nom. inval.)]|nr:N-terminal L-serine N(alpha)-acetyltransferase NatD [Martiniozyma asiatica]